MELIFLGFFPPEWQFLQKILKQICCCWQQHLLLQHGKGLNHSYFRTLHVCLFKCESTLGSSAASVLANTPAAIKSCYTFQIAAKAGRLHLHQAMRISVIVAQQFSEIGFKILLWNMNFSKCQSWKSWTEIRSVPYVPGGSIAQVWNRGRVSLLFSLLDLYLIDPVVLYSKKYYF